MGLLGKIIAAKATSGMVQKMNERRRMNERRTAAESEYIPAGREMPASTGGALQRNAGAVVDRAGRFYRENPKMVASLGVAAALMALSALKRRTF